MRLQSFILCTTCLALSSVCAIAGSAAAGGAQVGPTDNATVSTYKATDTSVGASARDSAGASTSQTSGPSGTTNTNASSSSAGGAASPNGSAPSTSGISPRVTEGSNNISAEIRHEKVIDTGDKAIDTDKSAKVESSDKTFAPGALDKVSDISIVSAQKAQTSASKANESKSAASDDKNDPRK
jgi:hypothetical protein